MSYNKEKYVALIMIMKLENEMGASNLQARNDFQLVTSHVIGNYETNKAHQVKYLYMV